MYHEKNFQGYTLSWSDERAFYMLDDKPMPNVTALLEEKYAEKIRYAKANSQRLSRYHLSQLHDAICDPKNNETDFREYKNFLKLCELYGMKADACDVPVVLYNSECRPIACDIVDLIVKQSTGTSLVIMKRQRTIDRRYYTDKANLLALAFNQTYGDSVHFCKCIQLLNDLRKLTPLVLNETLANEVIIQYGAKKNNEENADL